MDAPWKKASSFAHLSLLKEVLSQKPTRHLNISSIKIMHIKSISTDDVYIFDFNSPHLCGISGCLYSIYKADGKLLAEFIANPYLLPKEKLIQVSDTINQGFPCLIISQNTNTKNLLLQTQFCYQQYKYIRFNENFTVGGKIE